MTICHLVPWDLEGILSHTKHQQPSPQGALALTYKEQYKSPFLPVMPGHVLAEYNNLESAAAAIQKGRTAAVFVEPIQGEGGCTPSQAAFLSGLRKVGGLLRSSVISLGG